MRRVALVVALLAGLAGGAVAPERANASCAFIVVWHDHVYTAFWGPGRVQVTPGARIRGAEQPGCNDTVGANEPVTTVAARRIAGVSPSVTILAENQPLVAYGYFPEASGFPIGDGEPPADETRGCSLGGPVRITGPAQLGLGAIGVHVRESTVRLHHLLRGSAQVFIDARTVFVGLVRHGLPSMGEGQLVRVDARFCKVPGSIGTKIVARRIAAAGPIVPPSTAEDILGDDWRGKPDIVSKATGGHALAVAIVLLVAALGVGTALTTHRRRSLPPPTG